MFSFKQHVQGFIDTPSLKGLIKGIQDFDIGVDIGNTNASISAVFPPTKRLGKRAEFLFEEILKSTKNPKLLGSNIPLRNAERTIGEIDYILQTKSGVVHLELATKFYLFDKSLDSTNMNQWIGPNRKDFLHLKVSKLQHHQFPIIASNEFQEYIQSSKIPQPTRQSLLLKAQLFTPLNIKHELPDNYKDCIVGNWLTLEQFNGLHQASFFMPNKQDWFIHPNENNQWVSKQECFTQIKAAHSRAFSPMIWIKNQTGTTSKAFVVWW